MLKIFRKFHKNPTASLSKFLDGYELPSFPHAVMNVLSMLRSSESLPSDIAAHIEMDPGMHVKVLRAVNSAAFGLSTKVTNVPHAIVLLGRSRLESLMLSVVVKDVVSPINCTYFNETGFWLGAARRASLARALALHLHPTSQAESFTAGLLQDIAVPLLMMAKGEEYSTIYDSWKSQPDAKLDVLEQDALGYHHADIGSMMIKQWGLPETLAASIATHHDDSEDDSIDLAVRLMALIRDDEHFPGTDTLASVCCVKHGLSEELVKNTIETALENAKDFSRILMG